MKGNKNNQDIATDNASSAKKGSSSGIVAIIVFGVLILMMGAYGFFYGCRDSHGSGIFAEDNEADSDENKYSLVVYNDSTGEFLNPQGGRICGVKLDRVKDETYLFQLTRELKILGYSTHTLFVADGMITPNQFSSAERYKKPVEVKDLDGVRYYYFHLKKDDIKEKYRTMQPIDIKSHMRDNQYLMIVYDEAKNYIEYADGALYDPEGNRVCGVTRTKEARDYYALGKPVILMGESTQELYIENGVMYTAPSSADVRNRFSVTHASDGNAVIYTFSANGSRVAGEAKSTAPATSSTTTAATPDAETPSDASVASTSTATDASTPSTPTAPSTPAAPADPVTELKNVLGNGVRFGNDKMTMKESFYYSSTNVVEFKFTQTIFTKEAAKADPSLVPGLVKSLSETRKKALRGSAPLMKAMAPLRPAVRDVLYYPDGTECCRYTMQYSDL